MKILNEWYGCLKQEQPALHHCFVVLYFVLPVILFTLSVIDGLLLISTEHPSSFSTILLGEAILAITHLSTAGTTFGSHQGESEKATTIACYGGFTLIFLLLLVP